MCPDTVLDLTGTVKLFPGLSHLRCSSFFGKRAGSEKDPNVTFRRHEACTWVMNTVDDSRLLFSHFKVTPLSSIVVYVIHYSLRVSYAALSSGIGLLTNERINSF
jgi:hypothetical protein